MSGCGLMHNHLLHGSNIMFVNTVAVNKVNQRGELAAPSSGEVEDSERALMLLQIKALQVRVQERQRQGIAFWDA